MKLAFLIIASLAALLASLFFGAADLSISQTLGALAGQGREIDVTIVRELRLPRALLGAVIGAGLGASGAALQGYTRNPLAAPGILGFTSCAALGAVLALYFGFSQAVPFAALLGTALGALLILKIAGPRKGASTLILAGVGVGALATALTGLIMNFAPNPWALSEIVYWLMGSLKNAELGGLLVCAPLTGLGIALLIIIGPDLRTLSLGEETAASLGVSLGKVRAGLIAGTALCVGSGVAIAGAIGFIGLFVPHIIRLIFGPDPLRLIPFSAIGGAGFLVFADVITRTLTGPGTQLYLGILTSLIGVPFFLYLAVKETRT
ncbi:FecCD family ABC transporter permease [Hellea balneolensis]|uniref:FecCD family ABC transporter permease n=1 Tax=Hellea balneolensis TaxID=287478 RepID=UPI00041DBDBC|nr:iron ABC transporter permease [Hellea balneolensis]